jgi:hypothetical protein
VNTVCLIRGPQPPLHLSKQHLVNDAHNVHRPNENKISYAFRRRG